MSLLDQVIGDETNSNCSTSVSTAARSLNHKRIPINKKSTLRIKNIDDVKSIVMNQSMSLENAVGLQAAPNPVQSELKSLNDSAHETIEDFIDQIKKELTKSEYESFGLALVEWQKGQLFENFCMKALKILGKNRIHLIVAMKPFIPQENIEWFKKFVKTNNENTTMNAYWSSESSLNSNSDAESILSHYFSDIVDNNNNKATRTTGTGMQTLNGDGVNHKKN